MNRDGRMRTERSQREQTKASEHACMIPCASCGKPAIGTRDGLPICRDCCDASRPHREPEPFDDPAPDPRDPVQADPYDDLGGGAGGD
jgi:hypothetical protein